MCRGLLRQCQDVDDLVGSPGGGGCRAANFSQEYVLCVRNLAKYQAIFKKLPATYSSARTVNSQRLEVTTVNIIVESSLVRKPCVNIKISSPARGDQGKVVAFLIIENDRAKTRFHHFWVSDSTNQNSPKESPRSDGLALEISCDVAPVRLSAISDLVRRCLAGCALHQNHQTVRAGVQCTRM